jgi:hypothetical protein
MNLTFEVPFWASRNDLVSGHDMHAAAPCHDASHTETSSLEVGVNPFRYAVSCAVRVMMAAIPPIPSREQFHFQILKPGKGPLSEVLTSARRSQGRRQLSSEIPRTRIT